MSPMRTAQRGTTATGALGVALALTLLATPAHPDVATISVSTRSIVFPMVTDAALDAGFVERDPARRAAALTIVVEPIVAEAGWTLYIRAEQSTTASGTTA